MNSLLHLSVLFVAMYASYIRMKVRKEKENLLGIVLIIVLLVVSFVPLMLSIFTSNRFFDERIEYFTSLLMLVLCTISLTDIGFGTFSKPGTVRKESTPKKRDAWFLIAWLVGSLAVMFGVIIVLFLLSSNY